MVQRNVLDRHTVRMARTGYSLIEILIAIVIVGMLAGGVMFMANKVMQDAKRSTTKTNLQAVKYSLMQYKQEKGEYPERLQQAVEAGFIKKPLLKDGWDQPLYYNRTEDGIVLESYGPEGKKGPKASRIKG